MSTSVGSFTSVVYNDKVYLVNSEGVHEFINGNFLNISDKINVDLRAAEAWPLALTISNNTLILCPTDGQRRLGDTFDAWAMNLDTNGWSMYDFGQQPLAYGPNSKSIPCYDGSTRRNLYGDGKNVLSFSIEQVVDPGLTSAAYDLYSNGDYHSPEYGLTTFALNFGDSTQWKKIKSVEVLGYSSLPVNDEDVLWQMKLDQESGTYTADREVPTTELVSLSTLKVGVPERIPTPIFRCKLFILTVLKENSYVGVVLPVESFFEIQSLDVSYLATDAQSVKAVS
jgi:hypothetical protein